MRKSLITFGWVWSVCFLAAWGLMSFLKVAGQHIETSGIYLGLISLGVSLPIGAIITLFLNIFRSVISGTEYEEKLEKAKGIRIGMVSFIVGIIGFGEAVAFNTGIGNIVFLLAFIGMLIGGAVHLSEMFNNKSA